MNLAKVLGVIGGGSQKRGKAGHVPNEQALCRAIHSLPMAFGEDLGTDEE